MALFVVGSACYMSAGAETSEQKFAGLDIRAKSSRSSIIYPASLIQSINQCNCQTNIKVHSENKNASIYDMMYTKAKEGYSSLSAPPPKKKKRKEKNQ